MPGAFPRIADLRRRAEDALPRLVLDGVFGPTDGDVETTSRRNEAAFAGFDLLPRVLVDTSGLDLTTTVLGREVSIPLLLAPAGGQRRLHPEGERASARAAAAAGTVMIVSSFASYGLEEIASEGGGAATWFQLYPLRGHPVTELLVRRAEAAGCQALVLTVDVNGRSREWSGMPEEKASDLGIFAGLELPAAPFRMLDPAFTWSDLERLRSITHLPLVIKGILTAPDAVRCVEAGARAVVVSNHGGYSLQGARAAIEALAEIAQAVGEDVEVYLDGGVRRGTDVLKALGLGARAVLIGRSFLWGLAAGGEAGVRQSLHILRDELAEAMLLCGVPRASDIPLDTVCAGAHVTVG